MQKKGLIFLIMGCLWQMPAYSADLLADEQGPTAYGAVDTLTAGDDFLLPTYMVPADPVSPTLPTPTGTQPVPSDVDILNEIFGSGSNRKTLQPIGASPRGTRTFTPNEGLQKEGEAALLTPLPPLPEVVSEIKIPPKDPIIGKSAYADQMLAKILTEKGAGTGIPRELRITFYPGQSTISSQAMKWIKAFGAQVVHDPRLIAEIRVSNQDWTVQDRRLGLVAQALAEVGVSAHQMRIYRSERQPDSILIGYAPNPDYTVTRLEKKVHGTQKRIDW